MDDNGPVERQTHVDPAFTGGSEAATFWLDCMERVLAKGGSYEATVEFLTDALAQNPGQIGWHIDESARAGLSWDVLDMFVRRQWTSGKPLPIETAVWWLDATTGVTKKPIRDGKRDRRNLMRDSIIAMTINTIHDVTDLPYEFDEPSKPGREPRTACHLVAERLGMPYHTVRSIFENQRPSMIKARKNGRLPPARKRRRRTS